MQRASQTHDAGKGHGSEEDRTRVGSVLRELTAASDLLAGQRRSGRTVPCGGDAARLQGRAEDGFP